MRLFVSGSTASMRKLAPTWGEYLGHLLTPANGNSVEAIVATGLPWGVDNGCFTGFDPERFIRLASRVVGHPGLQWVVCPDVIGWAKYTLMEFREWHPRLATIGVPVAFVLQDGQENLEMPWGDIDAVFVGGSTAFKLSQAAADLVRDAKRQGKLAHMGRVNSVSRIEHAAELGCDSVDGTSMSMFGDTHIPRFAARLSAMESERSLFA